VPVEWTLDLHFSLKIQLLVLVTSQAVRNFLQVGRDAPLSNLLLIGQPDEATYCQLYIRLEALSSSSLNQSQLSNFHTSL